MRHISSNNDSCYKECALLRFPAALVHFIFLSWELDTFISNQMNFPIGQLDTGCLTKLEPGKRLVTRRKTRTSIIKLAVISSLRNIFQIGFTVRET